MKVDFSNHPLIKKGVIEPRKYQIDIAKSCLSTNTLVCLPTGLGKTVIAALVLAERFRERPSGKCLILSPTRPLILQHCNTMLTILDIPSSEFCTLSGEISPTDRAELWMRCKVVFATPQALENDLVKGAINLNDVILIVFDEAHRAVGNYPYVFIAERYMQCGKDTLILGLTASPGSVKEKINELCRNLHIQHIEVRTERSPDVSPYIVPTQVEWHPVHLPPVFREIKQLLQSFLKEKLKLVKDYGFMKNIRGEDATLKVLLGVKDEIRKEINKTSTPSISLHTAFTNILLAIKVIHAEELLESQGLAALSNYFEKLKSLSMRPGAPKSVKTLLSDNRMKEAIELTNIALQEGLEHPKMDELVNVLKENLSLGRMRRAIIFTNYRETARTLTDLLNTINGIKAVRFVGQTNKPDDRGLTQNEQAKLLAEFKAGNFNILVATQVAEEGLDISECDVVVFYDNVPSAIRFIQRCGRTGRCQPGKIVILVARETKDEAYYYIAKARERRMREVLMEMQDALGMMKDERKQPKLETFIAPIEGREIRPITPLTVYVDSREGPSQVVKELMKIGVNAKLVTLAVGDYVVSERVAVERKTVDDFASSIIDRRLFQQLKELKEKYELPLLLIEGEELYSARNISSEAIRGAISSILVDFSIPIIWTKNSRDSALMLSTLARREQTQREVSIPIRSEKKPLTITEQQEYLIAGLPNINRTLAKRLLRHFGTAEKVFTASKDELKKVPGIGEKIASKIRTLLSEKYEEKT
ncbi:DEAD/DEAH box helicase [Candidatus Bathyarchaeota archaeon]|nr:DEAD/DEAH box helicase [Candidatus Bathyarchaeota archaeon]